VDRTGGSTARARELLGWEPKVELVDGLRAQLDDLRALGSWVD
jgi:nucleoside-diphosphate-sugar epimerase